MTPSPVASSTARNPDRRRTSTATFRNAFASSRVEAIYEDRESIELDEADKALIPDALTPRDGMVLKLVLDFGKTLSDEDLKTAVAYCLTDEGKSLGGLLLDLLVKRGQIDEAA